MAVNKKPQVFGNRHVNTFLSSVSKAALADLVVDLLRKSEGDEVLDDVELLAAIQRALEPVALARGEPKTADVPAFFARLARSAEKTAAGPALAEVAVRRLKAKAESCRAVAQAVTEIVRGE